VCEDVAGLRGYVGVDVVLGEREAALIELNPRLTTSYLGLRAAFDQNLAGLALAACGGRLPQPAPAAARPVVYSADGRVRRERG
jgi:predicted ATP-grasp superfamily ATP-dependent carboligase